MCKTKIVATLGPASQTRETLTQLIQAGVNVVRLNFSHGSAEEHIARAEMVREIAQQLNVSVGVLVDLQGPKIRIACFAEGAIQLAAGDTFILDGHLDRQSGTQERVGLDYPELIDDLKVGNILLLDDGRIQLEVTSVDTQARIAHTVALNSGKLSNRKGINLLGGGLSAPALTDKDKLDIITAAELQADFLAVSFPRNAEDIEYARQLAVQAGCHAHIVAKVERAEVVASEEAMDSVIRASDVIMVARGDLGVEIGDARLPSVQKALIARAKHLGKPVITATQMMESMIENPLPTRAEVLDVANAVIDGTDAIMLSAESAAGRYPVEAVQAMVRIAQGVEHETHCAQNCWDALQHLCSDAGKSFALSSMISASKVNKDLGVAIVTEQGETPLLMSRCQSQATIWAVSDKPALLRKLAILRGVTPTYFPDLDKQGDIATQLIHLLRKPAQEKKIASILVTQLESVEGVGHVNVCRLLNLAQQEALFA
ncbi:pyruvate kinase [Vibrio cholerae]|uniref:pyruvate kinase n=1 Tax=Vibrio cholerae TaxID=666 RepID=UPI0011D8E911|nr:pyruvate kinase [Vibrio cholerae]EGR0366298.1 pyruvate kinase [Vibrio cholerae]EGR0938235.1 pyruvate kinase [Vibrio cholerae]EIA0768918.1 pyruvate kinase [Vibrio cholerae]EID0160479.1 pyruvate kinase [Vibrio cholerae]EJL6349854.1 pyruvate kinase [Vibrio cholerae]